MKELLLDINYKLEKLYDEIGILEERIDNAIKYIEDNACYSDGHCKCSFSQMALDNVLNMLKGSE